MAEYERTRDTLQTLKGEEPALEDLLGVVLDLRDDVQDGGTYLEEMTIRDPATLVQRMRAIGRLLLDIAGNNPETIQKADRSGKLAERLGEVKETEAELEKACKSIEVQEEALKKRESDASETKRKIDLRRQSMKEKEAQIESLQQETERLNRKCDEIAGMALGELKKKLTEAQARKTAQDQQLAEADDQLKAVEETCAASREKHAQLERQISETQETMDGLSRSIEENKSRLAGLQKQKEELESRLGAQKAEQDELKQEQKQLDGEIQNLQSEVLRLRNVIAQTDPEKLRAEKNRLEKEKDDNEAAYLEAKGAFEEAKSEAEAAAKRRDEAQRALEEAESSKAASESEFEKLLKSRENSDKALEELKVKIQETQNYLDGQGKDDLAEARKRSDELKKQQQDLEAKILQITEENGKRKDAILRRQSDNDKLIRERSSLLNKESEINQIITKIGKEISSLEERKCKREETLKVKEKEYAETKEKVEDEVSKFEQLIVDREGRLEGLNARLEKFKQANKLLFKDLEYVPEQKYAEKKRELASELERIRKDLGAYSAQYEKLCSLINGESKD